MSQIDNTIVARNVLANALTEFSSNEERRKPIIDWLGDHDSVEFWCTIADLHMGWYLSIFRLLGQADASVRPDLSHQVKISINELPINYSPSDNIYNDKD